MVSGQLGISPQDKVPADIVGQTRQCFENVKAILHDAGMKLSDIVRINAFVTDRRYLQGYMKTRDEFIASPPPASTLMIVSGFAREEFLVEIEVLASAD